MLKAVPVPHISSIAADLGTCHLQREPPPHNGLSNTLPTVTPSSAASVYSTKQKEMKGLAFSVSTILSQQSLCRDGRRSVDSMIACAAREGPWWGIALLWYFCTRQDFFACNKYWPSPLLWDGIVAFGKAENNEQSHWSHFASVNMLLLGIYLDLRLIHI